MIFDETLKNAVTKAQKTIQYDRLAYDYGISPPTLRKAINGEEIKQIRAIEALNEIIKDFGNK